MLMLRLWQMWKLWRNTFGQKGFCSNESEVGEPQPSLFVLIFSCISIWHPLSPCVIRTLNTCRSSTKKAGGQREAFLDFILCFRGKIFYILEPTCGGQGESMPYTLIFFASVTISSVSKTVKDSYIWSIKLHEDFVACDSCLLEASQPLEKENSRTVQEPPVTTKGSNLGHIHKSRIWSSAGQGTTWIRYVFGICTCIHISLFCRDCLQGIAWRLEKV